MTTVLLLSPYSALRFDPLHPTFLPPLCIQTPTRPKRSHKSISSDTKKARTYTGDEDNTVGDEATTTVRGSEIGMKKGRCDSLN